MAGNTRRPGATRKVTTKKGPTVGSGGQRQIEVDQQPGRQPSRQRRAGSPAAATAV